MSQITKEIESRKALIGAEEAAKAAKRELHLTILKGMTDPFNSIFRELKADGWRAEDPDRELTLRAPCDHLLAAWQTIVSYGKNSLNAYFRVNADSSTLVKLEDTPITLEDLHNEVLDHVAKYYVQSKPTDL